jgi:hypothetical protein
MLEARRLRGVSCPKKIGYDRPNRRTLVTLARAARYDRRKPPPPDLPSLLFDQRIVYLGMPVSSACVINDTLHGSTIQFFCSLFPL